MSNKKHHKRRNVGLMYEFIVCHIAAAVGSDDRKAADDAVAIVKRRFKQGTELHREWRLFNAVVNTTGVDETMANAIIREARDACRRYDMTKLESEKTQLIHEVNRKLGQAVYDRPIERYKLLATVQTLFNDWRDPQPNIGRIAMYERQLHQHLMSKPALNVTHEQHVDHVTDAFAVQLMVEKMNDHYGDKMTSRQRALLGSYIADGMSEKLLQSMRDLKESVLRELDRCIVDVKSGTLVAEASDITSTGRLTRLAEMRDVISDIDVERPDDITFARVLKLCELEEALKS